jgi:hypothetical protein
MDDQNGREKRIEGIVLAFLKKLLALYDIGQLVEN